MFAGIRTQIRSNLIQRFGISQKEQILRVYDEQFTYGQREVLLEYIGAPVTQIFLAKIPHSGHSLNQKFGRIQPEWDYKGDPILQVVWNLDIEEDARSRGISNVIAVGSPFIYHLLNEGYQLGQIENNFWKSGEDWEWPNNSDGQLSALKDKRVLYMPLHSWEGEVFESRAISNKFLNRVTEFAEFGVCLGYLDFLNPGVRSAYSPFAREVHCAGLPSNEIRNSRGGGRTIFFKSLQKIMEKYDVIVGEEFTTGLLYGSALGKKVALLDRTLSHQPHATYHKHQKIELEIRERLDLLRKDYQWLSGGGLTNAKRVSNLMLELGLESIKSPVKLASLIPRLEFYFEEK